MMRTARPNFKRDHDAVEAGLRLIPSTVNLNGLMEVFIGPVFGKSAVEKLKSNIGNERPSPSGHKEQIDLQSILKRIMFEDKQALSLWTKYRSIRRLQSKKELQNSIDYFQNGKELFETFSVGDGCFAQMFPTCPNQQYIDLYEITDQTDVTPQVKTDLQKQQDYEAEVKVYRALENVRGENVSVIHGLKYSHYQYRMFDANHQVRECSNRKQQPNCKKGLHSDEGENDFVVLGPNYFALIEVKNAEKEASIASMKNFVKSASKQLDKLIQVIEGIAHATIKNETLDSGCSDSSAHTTTALQSNSFKVFRFVAFPRNNNRLNTAEFVTEQENVRCIFDCDFDNFADWWNRNALENPHAKSVDVQGHFEKVKYVLWTLWATKDKTFDGSSIGFKVDLLKTDKLLKDSEITFTSKNRQLSPNVARTSDMDSADVNGINVFHDILGIKFITKNQKEAFENQSKNLIITGCAGSGKSLMLIARFLHQALTSSDLKMLLLVFNQLKLVEYKKFFARLKLSCVDLSEVDFDPNLWQSRVAVIHCNTQLKNSKTLHAIQRGEVVIYVDDAHASDIDFMSLKCACIAVDFNQCHLPLEQTPHSWTSIEDFDLVSLTHNYRSTWNIVSNLTNLSKAVKQKDALQRYFAEHPPELSHHPSHGHLIHGPQTEIDVIHFKSPVNNTEQLTEVLQLYIKKMHRHFPKTTNLSSKFFIIVPDDSFLRQVAQEINSLLNRHFSVIVNAWEQSIYSTEFTACFIYLVFSNMDTKMLRSVYNVISRARAFCHIMVVSNKNTEHEELNEFLGLFKEAKINHIRQPENSADQNQLELSLD